MIAASPTFLDFCRTAIGMPVSHIWRGYGSAIFVQLGALRPTTKRNGSPGNGQGELELMIQGSWRIEVGSTIRCGSWSEEELWEPTFASLIGKRVTSLTTFGRLPELWLSLTDEIHVMSYATSDGDPEWAAFDRRGTETITYHCRSGQVEIELPGRRKRHAPATPGF